MHRQEMEGDSGGQLRYLYLQKPIAKCINLSFSYIKVTINKKIRPKYGTNVLDFSLWQYVSSKHFPFSSLRI